MRQVFVLLAALLISSVFAVNNELPGDFMIDVVSASNDLLIEAGHHTVTNAERTATVTFDLTLPVVGASHEAVQSADIESGMVTLNVASIPIAARRSALRTGSPLAVGIADAPGELMLVDLKSPLGGLTSPTGHNVFAGRRVNGLELVRSLQFRAPFTVTADDYNKLQEQQDQEEGLVSGFHKPSIDCENSAGWAYFRSQCGLNWPRNDRLPKPIAPEFPPLIAGAKSSFSGDAVFELSGMHVKRAGLEIAITLDATAGLEFHDSHVVAKHIEPHQMLWLHDIPSASISLTPLFKLGFEGGFGFEYGLSDASARISFDAEYLYQARAATNGAIFLGYQNGKWDWPSHPFDVDFIPPKLSLLDTLDKGTAVSLTARGFVAPFVRGAFAANHFNMYVDAGVEMRLDASVASDHARCANFPHLPATVDARLVPFIRSGNTQLDVPGIGIHILDAKDRRHDFKAIELFGYDDCMTDPARTGPTSRHVPQTELTTVSVVAVEKAEATPAPARITVRLDEQTCPITRIHGHGSARCSFTQPDLSKPVELSVFTSLDQEVPSYTSDVPARDIFSAVGASNHTFIVGDYNVTVEMTHFSTPTETLAIPAAVEGVTDLGQVHYDALRLPSDVHALVAMVQNLESDDGAATWVAGWPSVQYAPEWATPATGHIEEFSYPAGSFQMMELRVNKVETTATEAEHEDGADVSLAMAVAVGEDVEQLIKELPALRGDTVVDAAGVRVSATGEHHLDDLALRYPCSMGLANWNTRILMQSEFLGDTDATVHGDNINFCVPGAASISAGDARVDVSWAPVPHMVPVTYRPPEGWRVANQVVAASFVADAPVAGAAPAVMHLEPVRSTEFTSEYGVVSLRLPPAHGEIALVVDIADGEVEWLGEARAIGEDRTVVAAPATTLHDGSAVVSLPFRFIDGAAVTLTVFDVLAVAPGGAVCGDGVPSSPVPAGDLEVGCFSGLNGYAGDGEHAIVHGSTHSVRGASAVMSSDKKHLRCAFTPDSDDEVFGFAMHMVTPDAGRAVFELGADIARTAGIADGAVRFARGQCEHILLQSGDAELELAFPEGTSVLSLLPKTDDAHANFVRAFAANAQATATCFCGSSAIDADIVPSHCLMPSTNAGLRLVEAIDDQRVLGLHRVSGARTDVSVHATRQFVDFAESDFFYVDTPSFSVAGIDDGAAYKITEVPEGHIRVVTGKPELYLGKKFTPVRVYSESGDQLPVSQNAFIDSATLRRGLGACEGAAQLGVVDADGTLFVRYPCLSTTFRPDLLRDISAPYTATAVHLEGARAAANPLAIGAIIALPIAAAFVGAAIVVRNIRRKASTPVGYAMASDVSESDLEQKDALCPATSPACIPPEQPIF